jgi:hypothetical protein
MIEITKVFSFLLWKIIIFKKNKKAGILKINLIIKKQPVFSITVFNLEIFLIAYDSFYCK